MEGGESIVVDLLAVMENLRVTHPHHFATLVSVPATFFRIHYKRYFKNYKSRTSDKGHNKKKTSIYEERNLRS